MANQAKLKDALYELQSLIVPALYPFPCKTYADVSTLVRIRAYLYDPEGDGEVLHPDYCWHWSGPTGTGGAPCVYSAEQDRINPQRLLYRLMREDFPPYANARYLCRTARCCNPYHLQFPKEEDLCKSNQKK